MSEHNHGDDGPGFILTHRATIDITPLLGERMDKAAFTARALIPRKMTIFRWGPKGVSGA
jgi:hypothetical protein